MATPVIHSATVTPDVVAPGGSFVVKIVATDPDSQTYTFPARVKDSEGNERTVELELRVSDPLTFELDVPSGFVAVQRPGEPGVFDCTAPAG